MSEMQHRTCLGSELLQLSKQSCWDVTELSKDLPLFSYGSEIINRLNRNIVVNLQMICRSEKSRGWGAQ